MARGGTSVTVDLSGPFFERDPGKTLRGNIEKMMEALAAEGERSARSALQSSEGSRAPIRLIGDHVSAHVVGRVRSRAGKKWRASAVVQVYNEGLDQRRGRSLMAAASVVEKRTRVFRNLRRSIAQARAVLAANLTEGIE